MKDNSSIDKIIEYINSISSIGEKVAGSTEELKAARLIETEFDEFGLDNVHLEPFPVVCRLYKESSLEMIKPSVKDIPCVNGGTSVSSPLKGIIAELVDAGFGTITDYENLSRSGVELEGKIALIERSDRLTGWPDIACRLASNLGILGVIFTNFGSEHTAFRKEAFPFTKIPVVSVQYLEAQKLRELLREKPIEVRLKNIIETDEKGTSYNVIGEITGSKYPEEIVTLSAHHDSWFKGAHDNASAVAIMLETARFLAENHQPKRTLRFISFGSEESGSDSFFEWSVGSYQHLKSLEEKVCNYVANVNMDIPAFGDQVVASATPEMTTYVSGIVNDLDLCRFFTIRDQPTSWTDQWSFVIKGVPSVNLGHGFGGYEKIYHTQYDALFSVTRFLVPHVLKVSIALMKGLGSSEILPFNLIPTIDRLKKDLEPRSVRLTEIVNLSGVLREADKLIESVKHFNNYKTVIKDSLDIDIKTVNEAQLYIISLLNKKMIGTGKNDNKSAAWIISEQLDMLENMKTVVEALRGDNLKGAITSLSSLRTMNWGLNVNLETYNETFNMMLNQNRYHGKYINVMAELESLKDKNKKGDTEFKKEQMYLEEQYKKIVIETNNLISILHNSLNESNTKLIQITSQ